MSTEIAEIKELTAEQQQTLSEKKKNWDALIERMYRVEISLNQQAQNQVAKVQLPKTIEQVPAAEQQLVELKRAQKAMEAQRMEITGTFDKLKQRFMLPEQSLEDPKKQLNDAIIAVKTEHEKKERAKKAKEQEVNNLVLTIKNHLAKLDHEFRTAINMKITVAYQYALDNNITPETIGEFITKASTRMSAADFQGQRPDVRLMYLVPEEAEEIFNQVWRLDPHAYATTYQTDLKAKFVDYTVAYNNKAEALVQAQREATENEARLGREKEQKELAAKMEATATKLEEPTVSVPTRELRKVYEVDMPDTLNSAILIISAFVAMRDKAEPRLATKKFLTGFTADSAAKALAKLKNEDNGLEIKGVVFKEVAKL